MTHTVIGEAYWTSTSKVTNQYPYLAEDISCEVAVVGGGIAGALCAYRLGEAGVDTVLLDAGLFGYGGTGVASSILQYDIDYNLDGLKELIGLDKAVRAYRACARGLDEIEELTRALGANVGFARRDSFYYTPEECGTDAMRQEYLLRRHHDFPVEFLDNVKAAERFSFRVGAGIYTAGMAGEIDPYRFTQALIAEGVANGNLRAFENTSIEVVTPDLSGIGLETATHRTVHAKKMVNATGLSGAKEAGRIAQPRTTFCIVTAPVDDFPGWYNRCIIRDDGEPYIYLRTLPDNRILIGGLDSCVVDSAGMIAKLFCAPNLMESKFERLEDRLVSMLTGIDNLVAEYRFAGTTCDTGDGLPYIGTRPGYPNVFYDISCGSNGIVFAELGADIIRDLYLGGDAADAELFAFGRL